MHEWPLIVFTLFLQASVGMLIASMLFLFISKAHKIPEIRHSILRIALCTSFLLAVLGLLASVFHLGNPYHMFYTLMNPFTSWMSREIWTTGFYLGVLFLSVICVFLQKRMELFASLSLLMGLFLIYIMGVVYIDSRFPLWATPATYFTFFASTLNLGAVCVLIAFAYLALSHPVRSYWLPLIGISTVMLLLGALLALVAAALLWAISLVPSMLSIGRFSFPDKAIFLHFIRLTLIGIAIILNGLLWISVKKNRKIIILFIFFSALCVIVSEGIGRDLFYDLSSSFYTTIPG